MPNIYDVAKRARVSVATVSAVLNESAFVSDGLKARVHAAVDALGYHPNLLARSMAKQRTQTLGMIVPDIANPFFPEVVRGAEDTARAAVTRCSSPAATTTRGRRRCTCVCSSRSGSTASS